ncbi:MAG: endo-1,4-beta-xylanase [Planctomycetota bacterium]
MGQLRFLVPGGERVDQEALSRAYLIGPDLVPWLTRIRWDEPNLVVERDVRESGNLCVPWTVAGHGELMLTTGSLMERAAPYHLPTELARGTLARLRHQLGLWQLRQIQLAPDLSSLVTNAQRSFVEVLAAQADPEHAAELAHRSLEQTLLAEQSIQAAHFEAALQANLAQSNKLTTLLGATITDEPLEPKQAKWLQAAGNTVALTPSWSRLQPNRGEWDWTAADQQLSWCRESGLKVIAGPLAHNAAAALPGWLPANGGLDVRQYQAAMLAYLDGIVRRWRGMIHVWHVAAGFNVESSLGFTEEQRFHLVVAAIQLIRSIDSETPLLVSLDQPWGEFLGRQPVDLPPFHFADMLIRSNLGITGLGLEINLGYYPHATCPRPLSEISRLVDQWGTLGLPLVTFLTVPSDVTADPLAGSSARPVRELGESQPSPTEQRRLGETLVTLLLSRPSVHGVIWNQLRDDHPHEFPHGGLFDESGRRKPIVEALTDLRRTYLM